MLLALVAVSITATAVADAVSDTAMRRVQGGTWVPFYRTATTANERVASYLLDREPVTNAAFLAFVRRHSEWRRSNVPRVFADEAYLSHWQGDLDLGPNARPEQPVTQVSWFAADAFCRARHARLPTEAEWEYAARASSVRADGSRDPAFVAQILQWYARPQPAVLPDVGAGPANVWGIRDLHGLVWEWVQDFNRPRALTDSRRTDENGPARFCGAAAVGAADVSDYAAFMRYAFRSSLRASYTVRNLGFRCAADLE